MWRKFCFIVQFSLGKPTNYSERNMINIRLKNSEWKTVDLKERFSKKVKVYNYRGAVVLD